MNCVSSEAGTIEKFEKSDLTILEAYGKKVYERESCSDCHTLQMENETEKLVSLDGEGGKRSSDWLFFMFIRPEIILAHTEAPIFSHLGDTHFDKSVMRRVINESGRKKELNKKMIWEQMYADSDTLLGGFKSRFITPKKRTEVFALIAYIQQIPSSDAKIKLDSTNNANALAERQKWGSFFNDTTGDFLKLLNNPVHIKNGKLLYESNCILCHDQYGKGSIGPNLIDEYWLYGGRNSDIANIIMNGAPKGMPAYHNILSPIQVGEVLTYMISLRGTNPADAKGPEGKKE